MSFLPLRTVQTSPETVNQELTSHAGQPVIVTKNGVPMWAIMPINENDLFDYVLATAPEFVQTINETNAAIANGTLETRPFSDLFNE